MSTVQSEPRIRQAAEPISPRALILRLGSLAIFVVVLVLLPELTDNESLKTVLPAFVALLYLQLIPLFWTNKPDLFAPPIFTGVYAAMATASTIFFFIQRGGIEMPLLSGTMPDELANLSSTTLWAMSLGTIAYYLGYYHPTWGKRWKRIYPRVPATPWDPGRLKVAALVVGVIYLITYGYFQVRVGRPLFDVSRLDMGKAVWRENPTLSWMMRGVSLGSMPVLLYMANVARGRGKTMYLWAGGVLLVGVLNVRLGQRGFLYNGLLLGAIIFHYLRRRLPALALVAAFLVAAVIGEFLGAYRTQTKPDQDLVFADAVRRPGVVLAEHEDDRQRFAAMALLFKEFPENHDYLLGESWLAIGGTLIPRWVWPDKGKSFVWRDANVIYHLAGASIPTSYLGLLYINFSWIGIIIGMFIWGMAQRGLYEWLLLDPGDPGRVVMYATLLVFFAFTMMALSATLQFAVPAYIMIRYVSLRRGDAQVESRAAA
jgi:hypothetical protein